MVEQKQIQKKILSALYFENLCGNVILTILLSFDFVLVSLDKTRFYFTVICDLYQFMR